jgi:NAD(P)-dependent dehydrogenase (short-subunit alcohol dehydrogenase family)
MSTALSDGATGFRLHGLADSVAIVTGAGRRRSIGRSVAMALATAGAHVVLTGTGRARREQPDDERAVGWRDVDTVADEVQAIGRSALPVTLDVTSFEAVDALATRVMDEFGRLDIVVNNAGAPLGPDRLPVLDMDVDAWRQVIDVNLTGAFIVSKVFGKLLVEQERGGSIVNISSVSGKTLPARASAYAASKAGLQALTGSMAKEVGQFGVRVNAICPGLIDTARMDSLGRDESWHEAVKTNIPLGRAGLPDDVANLVTFLCSDEGAWITGQHLIIDGGRAIGY